MSAFCPAIVAVGLAIDAAHRLIHIRAQAAIVVVTPAAAVSVARALALAAHALKLQDIVFIRHHPKSIKCSILTT